MKQFFSLTEILACRSPDLPASPRALRRMATGWRCDETKFRKAAGRTGGGGYEYHLSVLPASAQERLRARHAADGEASADDRAAAWRRYEGLSSAQKLICDDRLKIVAAVDALIVSGRDEAAAVRKIARREKIAASTLDAWRSRIGGAGREDRLAALAPDYRPTAQAADCHPDAWAALTADYLRPEQPAFTSCYRRVAAAATDHSWAPLPAERALRRRLEREIPEEVRVLAREGRERARRLYPAQRRSRTHLHAMQAVNMDGHRLDVFARLTDGRVTRVHLLAIQDLYSGKIVAHRLADSENKESVRLAIGDMVERYGIPERITLDNSRAFASKWISGGAPNRFRFKIRDEDPRGLLTTLGVDIVWTTPFSGQSKPIERAFLDLAEEIARHPFCAGAYTGAKPEAKPENYGAKAVPLDAFREHVAARIDEHNSRTGRKSAACAGRSFDETFRASMADPATLVKWPTAAQRSLWLLAAERITARKPSGEIHLFGNRYWSPALSGFVGAKLTARFDPDRLDRDLKVYDIDGKFVCDAPRLADAAFDSASAAREHARLRKAHQRALREQLDIHARLSPDRLAELYGAPARAAEKTAPPKVVRLATPAASPVWDEEAEELFSRAMARAAGGNIIDFPENGESGPDAPAGKAAGNAAK